MRVVLAMVLVLATGCIETGPATATITETVEVEVTSGACINAVLGQIELTSAMFDHIKALNTNDIVRHTLTAQAVSEVLTKEMQNNVERCLEEGDKT